MCNVTTVKMTCDGDDKVICSNNTNVDDNNNNNETDSTGMYLDE